MIVDSTDTGPPSDSIHLLLILQLRIAAKLISDDKGNRLLDEDRCFNVYLLDLGTVSAVEKQTKN